MKGDNGGKCRSLKKKRGEERRRDTDNLRPGSDTMERAPRGRCLPPVPPIPNPNRGEETKHKFEDRGARIVDKGRHCILVISEGMPEPCEPMPQWKREYFAFKRKVNSSAFIPLLLLLLVCGSGINVIGLTGVSLGYFKWSIGCEGVLMVSDEVDRADGEQTYKIGWAKYKGTGPSEGPDAVAVSSAAGNGTVGADRDPGGVAGSSIPNRDWLARIDETSAIVGAMSAVGHLLGSVFYATMLYATVRLFRSYFRSCRGIFRPAFIASGSLFVWHLSVVLMGFYLAVRRSFKGKILNILSEDGFLCQENSITVGVDFAYIATGFGCFTSASMFFLTWRFGQDADFALADRFERHVSLVELGSSALSN